ncbi:MAG TPA: hypothetical protein PLQ03_10755 [Brevundimonas sp.]|uniref:hypothetical protein n=2 Tax=Brevundimonas TaxID=41275 RepID=UPI002CFB76F1|nr:hypothetical protein [Brevundimonas sp.]HRO33879.1 hypothetical protein [Brevundimonas sp.]
MDKDARQVLAKDRAERYAPAPTGGAWMAGLCVAVVALGGDLAVSAFYGWSAMNNLLIAGLITLGGFVTGFVGYKRVAQSNRRAIRFELDQINAGAQDAARHSD